MAGQLPAITDLIPSSATLSPAQVLETRASSLRRMATLLRLARGAWTLAVYESSDVQRLMVEDLRQAVAPLPLIEIALDREETPDPLRIVRRIDLNGDAPVLSFHGIGRQLAELAGFLDIQRDALARHPHRLIFWTSERERRQLSEAAPNFYSRLSGVYYFPGGSHVAADNSSASRAHPTAGLATTGPEFAARRRRPYLPESEGRQRDQQIAFLNDRIQELHDLPRPNFEAIGDAWYDLAGVYERSMPRRWLESESAYAEAARAYAQSGLTLAEAEAHYQAGDAAMRGYGHHAALDHLATALRLYRLLAHSLASTPDAALGEANVLKAQGDVLAFLAQREEALARYGEALTLYRAVGDRQGEANVLASQGQVTLVEGDRDRADQMLQDAVAIYRSIGARYSVPAQIGNYGWALMRVGRVDEARPYLLQAAQLFTDMGLDDFAERHLQAAGVSTDPQEMRRLLDQALEASRQQDDQKQLIQVLAAAVELLQQLEDWPGVVTAAEELVSLGVDSAEIWAALAHARSAQDDESGAVEAYHRAVDLAPDQAMLRRNYANSLIALGRLDEAATQLAAAAELEPDAPYLALRRAELAKARGDRDEATRWATEALRRQPDWDEAQALLTWAAD